MFLSVPGKVIYPVQNIIIHNHGFYRKIDSSTCHHVWNTLKVIRRYKTNVQNQTWSHDFYHSTQVSLPSTFTISYPHPLSHTPSLTHTHNIFRKYWPALSLTYTHSFQAIQPLKEKSLKHVYIHWRDWNCTWPRRSQRETRQNTDFFVSYDN